MTRRLALAIFLTVWVTLVAAGAVAYFATRAVLLADLDESLVARALAVPQVDSETGAAATPLNVGISDRFVARDSAGRTIARPTAETVVAKPEILRAAFVTLADQTRVRSVTLRTPARVDGAVKLITISYRGSAEHFDSLLGQLAVCLIVAGLLGGALAAIAAIFVARRSLRPLHQTAEVVGAIDDQNLHRRINEVDLPPELVPVATHLNAMLARLEESMKLRQQFMADASHELRTPVAALVTALEVALRRPRDAESYRQTLVTCLTDAQLLRRLVESLLTQVRAGAAPAGETPEPFDLHQLISECVMALNPVAIERGIHLRADAVEDLRIISEPARIRSILINLIDNAIEYNRAGGEVAITCNRERDKIQLKVNDTGIGIAAPHLERIFQPLFRVDAARGAGHLGLGLSLIRMHVTALKGTCSVQSTLGAGTQFEITLPYVEEMSQFRPMNVIEPALGVE